MIEQRGMPAHLLIVSFVLCSMTGVCHAEPGLLGVYSDGENRVARVVPTPNFALGPRESIHSQIRTEFEATFTGSLMIERGGMYTILADADVSIGGKAVAGKRMMLTPGEHALKITYQRKPGSARLQLRWKPEFAVEEPIPPTAFVHDGADNEAAKKWASIEEGRSLFERHSCGACHGADGWMLSVGQGPNLSNIGGRVDRDWLASWLADPKQHRSTTTMPNLLEGKDEVRDVTAYLSKLVTTPSLSLIHI